MPLNGILQSAIGAASAGLRPPRHDLLPARPPPGQRAASAAAPALLGRVGAAPGLAQLADQHLQAASLAAAAEASRWSAYGQGLQTARSIVADLPARAQAAAAAVADGGADAAATAQDVTGAAQAAGGQLAAASGATDAALQSNLARANELLEQVAGLNRDVGAARLAGQDATSAQEQRAGLADQLAGLIGATATLRTDGGLEIRATDGAKLAGEVAANLVLAAPPGGRAQVKLGPTPDGASAPAVELGGAARGLLELRNDALPKITAQLAQLGQAASQATAAAQGFAPSAAAAVGLARLAQGFAAGLARETANAQSREDAAQAAAAAAAGRRQRLDGLDVRQELANLAVCQQAAGAAAQLTEGVRDLSQALASAA